MATTPNQLSGLFKEVYGDEIENLVPDCAKLTKLIPFVSSAKETGNKYHQPLIVTQEHGVTYAGPNDGAYLLEDAISMNMQDAQIQGSQLLLRSALSYDAAARASNDKKAFTKGTQLIVDNMSESIAKRLEICLMHGQVGIGVKSAATAVDATHTTVTVSTASFAAGIYAGLENAKVQFFLVSNGNLVSTGNDAVFTIDSVDIDNRQIVVSGSAAGNTALVAAGNADIYFKGSRVNASTWKEMAGLKKIITNSGTLFNVDASQYNLWKGNTSTQSGQLTMAKVLSALSKAISRGLEEKVVLVVNPRTWADLASDLAALRMFDGSYNSKKGENGFETLKYVAQSGEIEVISHTYCKEGEAFIFPPKKVKRIGAQEISFKTPGKEQEIFLEMPNNAGFELRVYSDQAVFVETPARCVYIDGFTNSAA